MTTTIVFPARPESQAEQENISVRGSVSEMLAEAQS